MGYKTNLAIGLATGAAIGVATPVVLGTIVGVSATGPVAGGLFATHMGAGVAAGSVMAGVQSFCMTGASYVLVGAGAATGAGVGSVL